MTIPLFSGDAGRSVLIRRVTHSYAKETVQILSYLITKEIYFEGRILVYRAVRYADQFPVAIKQSREAFIRNFDKILNLLGAEAASLENAGLYQQARSQLIQSEKMSVLGDLAAEVADKITAVFIYLNHIYCRGTAMLCPYGMVYLPGNSCNNSVSSNAVNLQPALDEVFHVRS
ncbi:MAG: hypothetical protein HWQ41_18335 [Nostoc sp. NOS(2021)]|uniref:hypothetical protein n=1 Tax=Nostoc sp. NOS(2021) TaxID=2815407 RepID=UPI0025FE2856|nr:hypothetical protein [Nostoc sp. NOS(2021)]MBN3897157.1 hypothetical protein [Nostoc sp. NOS(2021)]